jgi:GxxExxY protein
VIGDEGTKDDPLTREIIGAAIEVHKALGPGLLESAYERCLAREVALRGLRVERQVEVALEYKGERIDCAYRMDLVVEGGVLVEIKAVEKLLPIHDAQVLTYLRLTGLRKALLLNFNTPYLRGGIKRLVQ